MAGNEDESLVAERENDNNNADNNEAEKSERLIKLPMTRIKNMIKLDPDVTLASQDAVVMIAKATEFFIQELAKESYTYTMQAKRKTVQKKDLDNAIEYVDTFAFLEGALES